MRNLLIMILLLGGASACGDSPLPAEKDGQGGNDWKITYFDLGGDSASVADGAADAANDGASNDGASNDAGADKASPDTTVDTSAPGPDVDSCGGCTNGLDCVSGRCECIRGGSCLGCCASLTVCVYPATVAQCGANGSACFSCPDNRANLCIESGAGHCACSGPTYPGPSLPSMCDVGEHCDTSGASPICVVNN